MSKPDDFPVSEAGKRMLRRVSPIYDNSYFIKNLYQAMGVEWDEARELVLSLRDQIFARTVTWGIGYQEHKYSIVPDESLSLDERRARLIRRAQQKFPLNPGILEQYIRNGWDIVVDVDETVAPGYLWLSILNDPTQGVAEMIKDVRRIKPSHLVLMIRWECRLYDDESVNMSDALAAGLLTGYEDSYPYAVVPPPIRDGAVRHGGVVYHNGRFRHKGGIIRDGAIPGYAMRGGSAVNIDELALSSRSVFFDDVSKEIPKRGGDIFHDGLFLRGENNLPGDRRQTLSVRTCLSDAADITDTGGKLSALCSIYRQGITRRDGRARRGIREYGDRLDGGLSIRRPMRNGNHARDGDVARLHDALAIAI